MVHGISLSDYAGHYINKRPCSQKRCGAVPAHRPRGPHVRVELGSRFKRRSAQGCFLGQVARLPRRVKPAQGKASLEGKGNFWGQTYTFHFCPDPGRAAVYSKSEKCRFDPVAVSQSRYFPPARLRATPPRCCWSLRRLRSLPQGIPRDAPPHRSRRSVTIPKPGTSIGMPSQRTFSSLMLLR